MLARRLRRRPNTKSALLYRFVLAGTPHHENYMYLNPLNRQARLLSFLICFIIRQIADIKNEIIVSTTKFANVLSQKETNMSNFHSLEIVDRGSETQLQVSEIF